LLPAVTMNVTDDSDEDIFNATDRPASGCDSISSFARCAEDETCCEVLQLSNSRNVETCSPVNCSVESVMLTNHEAAVQLACSDFDGKCDLMNGHQQETTAVPHSELLMCESSVEIDSSTASLHCDGTGHTKNSIDCVTASDISLTATGAIQTTCRQTTQSVDSCVSVNSNELDDELLAELENEFSCTSTSVQIDSVSSDNSNTDEPLSSEVYRLSNDDLMSAFVTLQRRQQALECRLQNTLEARKQLEAENARLECKLNASLEALEAAKRDAESTKLEVCNFHMCTKLLNVTRRCSQLGGDMVSTTLKVKPWLEQSSSMVVLIYVAT